jgi:cystathionine beta-lyase
VICDEIHNDLICKGHKHTVYATLGEEYAKNCIIGTAPSKTFSLAGLCLANMIIPDPENKARFHKEVLRTGCTTVSTFGTVAMEVGYEECAPWVDEAMDYVKANHDYLTAFFAEHFPDCWVCPLEGTYLAWVDFASIEPDQEKRTKFLQEKAKLYLSNGTQFGAPTFERFNLACSREVLAGSLDRLLKAVKG